MPKKTIGIGIGISFFQNQDIQDGVRDHNPLDGLVVGCRPLFFTPNPSSFHFASGFSQLQTHPPALPVWWLHTARAHTGRKGMSRPPNQDPTALFYNILVWRVDQMEICSEWFAGAAAAARTFAKSRQPARAVDSHQLYPCPPTS